MWVSVCCIIIRTQSAKMDSYRERLIEFVRARPLLWDHRLPDYKDKDQKAQVWEYLDGCLNPPTGRPNFGTLHLLSMFYWCWYRSSYKLIQTIPILLIIKYRNWYISSIWLLTTWTKIEFYLTLALHELFGQDLRHLNQVCIILLTA